MAKFLDKSHYLDPLFEKNRYLEHENRIDDETYRNFLSRLGDPLKEKLSQNDKGLDFGCGHGPALADMLRSDGFRMDLYDPFFFPDKSIFSKKYDFITCTETAEHFFDPYKEFDVLDGLLVTGGWLGVMTCFLTDEELFENWYYRRDPTHVVFYAEKTFEVIASQREWNCEIKSKDVVLLRKV
ncbi:MAG: class I SAM-dependent methyltransferase [bacterium]